MPGPERFLVFNIIPSTLAEDFLALEQAIGLAHVTDRTLVVDFADRAAAPPRSDARARSGGTRPTLLDFLAPLTVTTATPTAFEGHMAGAPGASLDLALDLASAVFVDHRVEAEAAALADFAGARTVFRDPQERVLRLPGPNRGYYSRLFFDPRPSLHAAIAGIKPAAPYAALARQIAQSLGRFNGARILVGDIHKLTPYRGYDYAREILSNLADTLSGDELLVISTDEPDNADFFAPIVSHFTRHVFAETLVPGDFGRTLADLPAAGDAALAWVAHLVLRSAQEFAGTPGDAFSGITQRHVAIAQASRDLFFESRPFKFTYPGAATIDVPFESGQYLETRPGRFSWNRLDWPLGDAMLSRYREWPEAIPAQDKAGAGRESAAAESGPAASAAPRRFTMSTTFQGAYVPPQLSPGRDPATARRAVERDMQAIACDLMFGADRPDLIRRVEALGAPPAEARRIIESAYNDPLIANGRAMATLLRKRDWLLGSMERQRRLWPPAGTIERRSEIGAEEFLERYYAPGRPVILTGAAATWRAARWMPASLAAAAGEIEVVWHAAAEPRGAPGATGRAPFARFLDMASRGRGPHAPYLLADEHAHNAALARRLRADHGSLDELLDPGALQAGGMLWMGAANAFTPLHHDLVNCLVAQFAGRNRFKIIAAGEVAKLHNHLHAISEIEDLEAPETDAKRFPGLAEVAVHEVTLAPGEILYLPLAWWYQVRAEEFGITATYTTFRWPNDFYRSYPAR